MALPDDVRCAFLPVLTWTAPLAAASDCAVRLAALVEAHGGTMSLMASAQTATASAELLRRLFEQGHEIDLSLDSRLPLGEMSPLELEAELGRATTAFGDAGLPAFIGLRPATMQRIGIQKHEDIQAVLQARGLRFVSTDYSTKLPDNPASPGFADKNAAMLIKHSQPRRYPSGLIEVPAAGYSARDFLEVQQRSVEAWGEHLKACVDFAYDLGGLMFAPCLDLGVLAERDPECLGIRAALEHARAKRLGKVLICGLRRIVSADGA